MAIYDTFLFADPSERDVLLAKLHIENNIVDHWFVVDTAYSNTGKFKGYHCKKVLNDPAFLPFRQRITVVEYADNILETSSGGGVSHKVGKRHLDLRGTKRIT